MFTKFIVASIVIAFTLGLSGCKRRSYRLLPPASMEQHSTFRATVVTTDTDHTQSKHFGTIVVIYLKTETGETIGFGGTGMSDEFQAFARTLEKGKTYEFPSVWLEYKEKAKENPK